MIRGCVSLVGAAILAVAILVLGWMFRDDIRSGIEGALRGSEPAAVAESGVAPTDFERAEEKVIALGRGDSTEVALSSDELSGWIRFGLQRLFPDFVSDVDGAIDEDDRIVLSGRVAVERLPEIDRLGPAAALLGDTARVRVRGRVEGLEKGRGLFHVEGIQVGTFPLPEAFREEMLRRIIDERAREGLPANAVPFDLPPFVTDVSVRGGRLVLVLVRSRDD